MTRSRRLLSSGTAGAWLEALPLGNGRLGAMAYGDVERAELALNEGTIWSGGPESEWAKDPTDPDVAAAALAEGRRLIGESRFAEAQSALGALQGRYSQAYLPLGSLVIEVAAGDGGRGETRTRHLDLRTAVHEATGILGGAEVLHETFVSAVDGVLVHRVTGEGVALRGIALSSPLETVADAVIGDEHVLEVLAPADVAPAHEAGAEPLRWDIDGVSRTRAVVVVRQEQRDDGIVVALACETSFTAPGRPADGTGLEDRARSRVDAALELGVDALRERHVADHSALFDRVVLETPSSDAPPTIADLLSRVADEGPESVPEAVGLLFDYGRYLLIAASRPGGLPATLQGLWNASMRPPWSSNYTLNINTEMNYWGAESTGLPETVEPLVGLVEALSRTGAESARRLYGARGWTAHHNSDAWGHARPTGGDASWALWPMGGAWLCRHLLERVRFGSADEDFAEDIAWPVVRSAAEFVLDILIELPDGTLGTRPSTSPENVFRLPGAAVPSEAAFGTPEGCAAVATSSGMDRAIVRDLFTGLAELSVRIGREHDEVVREAVAALERIPGPIVGDDGGVQEWLEPVVALDPHHRHVSQLYAAYPGSELPGELMDAVARTLELRGDDSTGWSLAWKLCLWARLGRPDRIDDLLRLFFRAMPATDGASFDQHGGLYPNLFAAHPPFQIDGNLGFVGAIAETMLQSHAGEIVLLPALPSALATGSVTGLVARPGVLVDMEWREGELERAVLRAREGRAGGYAVRWGASVVDIPVTEAGTTLLVEDGELVVSG